jgi:glutathione S-transferase
MILGYWGIHGLGEPIRLLHALLSIQLTEIVYGSPLIDTATHTLQDWKQTRETLDTPIPNLPYYIDGDLCLCESMTILKHVCLLYPERLGTSKHDELLQFLWQSINILRCVCYEYVPQASTAAERAAGHGSNLYCTGTLEQLKNCFIEHLNVFKPNPFCFGQEWMLVDVLLYSHLLNIKALFRDINLSAYEPFLEAFGNLLKACGYTHVKRLIHAPFVKHNAMR